MRTDLRTEFIYFYNNELTFHPTYEQMRKTVEDSPWHREANVAIHTDMVVAEFIARSPDVWTEADLVGAFACAFHDFGKPAAEETVWSAERGDYRRYTGHEKMSARFFEDWVAQNFARFEKFGLTGTHVTQISWLVEHHLPWGIRKPLKREALARTAMCIGEGILERVLLSDTWGRLSDDFETKRANALEWVEEFQTLCASLPAKAEFEDDAPKLIMAIGTSGCGKSTYGKKLRVEHVHNMDQMRLDWYVDGDESRYNEAFERSVEDKQFASKVNNEFMRMVKTGESIYSDNTNTSAKRRAFYIQEARRRGYKVVAVLFPISLDEAIHRQKTRTDKSVPIKAVVDIYNAICMPQLGEFDEIQTNTHNLV